MSNACRCNSGSWSCNILQAVPDLLSRVQWSCLALDSLAEQTFPSSIFVSMSPEADRQPCESEDKAVDLWERHYGGQAHVTHNFWVLWCICSTLSAMQAGSMPLHMLDFKLPFVSGVTINGQAAAAFPPLLALPSPVPLQMGQALSRLALPNALVQKHFIGDDTRKALNLHFTIVSPR